jgi:hypothetical protein
MEENPDNKAFGLEVICFNAQANPGQIQTSNYRSALFTYQHRYCYIFYAQNAFLCMFGLQKRKMKLYETKKIITGSFFLSQIYLCRKCSVLEPAPKFCSRWSRSRPPKNRPAPRHCFRTVIRIIPVETYFSVCFFVR